MLTIDSRLIEIMNRVTIINTLECDLCGTGSLIGGNLLVVSVVSVMNSNFTLNGYINKYKVVLRAGVAEWLGVLMNYERSCSEFENYNWRETRKKHLQDIESWTKRC